MRLLRRRHALDFAHGLTMTDDLSSAPVVVVPEVRDYTRINAEVVGLLDAGHRHVRLVGVGGQRLLGFGLRGDWDATILVEGDAGPELASRMDAPRLVVVCTGCTRDGAGSGLRAGSLLVMGNVDAGVGYAQAGGTIVVAGSAGPRAGLNQSGGTLIVAGESGRLAGERQRGGRLLLLNRASGTLAHRGRTGGSDAGNALAEAASLFGPFWPESLPGGAAVG